MIREGEGAGENETNDENWGDEDTGNNLAHEAMTVIRRYIETDPTDGPLANVTLAAVQGMGCNGAGEPLCSVVYDGIEYEMAIILTPYTG